MTEWFTSTRIMEMTRLAEEHSLKLHYEHIARLRLQHNSIDTTYREVAPHPKPYVLKPTNRGEQR